MQPYFTTLAEYINYIVPEINEISYDTSYRYDLLGMCVQFNPYAIINYYIAYFLGMLAFRNYSKRHNLVSNIISSYVCWTCVFGRNTNNLLAYYYYDLLLLFAKKDTVLILHHIATIFCLNHCLPDYDCILFYKCLFLFKTGDLLLHYHKILDSLEIEHKFSYSMNLARLIINLYTFIAWMILRIILPLGVYPAVILQNNIIYFCFYIGNIWWTIKLYKNTIKSWYQLQNIIISKAK